MRGWRRHFNGKRVARRLRPGRERPPHRAARAAVPADR